jgi:hypothetical protein
VAHPGDGADAFEELRLVHGSRGVGRKVLKALAGGGMIDAAWLLVGEILRLPPPHYGVRPNDAAFHPITELDRIIRLFTLSCGVKPNHSAQ